MQEGADDAQRHAEDHQDHRDLPHTSGVLDDARNKEREAQRDESEAAVDWHVVVEEAFVPESREGDEQDASEHDRAERELEALLNGFGRITILAIHGGATEADAREHEEATQDAEPGEDEFHVEIPHG